jgi:putative endopeptidase
MAHEITHSFDELGNIYDAQGRLGAWWTAAEDHSKYVDAAAKLVEQFNHYCPAPDLCVNGKQVLAESIADLTGLLVAHDAYLWSVKGKKDVNIDGLNGEQRFYLAFARRWRKLQTETALLQQLKTDTHSPAEYRSDTVHNVDGWYDTFKIGPGDKLYLQPEERARIW